MAPATGRRLQSCGTIWRLRQGEGYKAVAPYGACDREKVTKLWHHMAPATGRRLQSCGTIWCLQRGEGYKAVAPYGACDREKVKHAWFETLRYSLIQSSLHLHLLPYRVTVADIRGVHYMTLAFVLHYTSPCSLEEFKVSTLRPVQVSNLHVNFDRKC